MFWDWHAIARDASGTQSAAASSPAAGGPGVKTFPGSAASHPGTAPPGRIASPGSAASLSGTAGLPCRLRNILLTPDRFLGVSAAPSDRLRFFPRRRRPLSSFFRHSCGPGNLPRPRLSPQTVPSRSARLSLCRSGRKWTDLPLADKKQGKLQACPARLRAGLPASEKA